MNGWKSDNLTRATVAACVVCGAAAALFMVGCSGSDLSDDGFNSTSAGSNVNFTGFYAKAGGGRIVSNSSGAPITTFTLFQTGNVVEAVDNNGSTYNGSVGVPNTLIPVGSTVATNGQQVAQAQVVLEGWDNTSGKKVEIVGVFSAVAVQDVASTSISGSNATSTSGSQTGSRSFTSSGASTSGQSVTTIIITPNSTNTFATGQSSGSSTDASGEITSGSTSEVSDSITTTQTFGLTRNNSQFELRGTWIEEGGVTGSVSGTSPGGVGTLAVAAPAN